MKRRTKIVLATLAAVPALLVLTALFLSWTAPVAVARYSHILANVPLPWGFSRLLAREVESFLAGEDFRVVVDDVALLRGSPTQAGVGTPKFYVWVRARDEDGTDLTGAMRVAAVEGDHFEVIQYVPCAELRETPERAKALFPADAMAVIEGRVAAECAGR